jgi:hypothetical protein
LLQAVKRNPDRFPDDFAFQLMNQEVARLKSQSVILDAQGQNPGGRRRGMPWAFTAQAELAEELRKLKRGIAAKFGQYDEQFRVVFLAIEQLIAPPEPNRPKIGFRRDDN